MSVRTPLVHPARYFRRDDRRVRGKHIVGLFLALYFLNGLLIALVGNWLTGEYPWTILLFASFGFLLIFAGVWTIMWAVFAAVMHYLTGGDRPDGSHRQALKDYLTGGDSPEGSYRQALDVVGWAFAPEVLLDSIVIFPFNWYLFTQVRAPTMSDIVTNAERWQGGYLEMFAGFVELTGAIWFSYILIYGVATTHDVSPRRAFVPAFLIFLYQVRHLVPPL